MSAVGRPLTVPIKPNVAARTLRRLDGAERGNSVAMRG